MRIWLLHAKLSSFVQCAVEHISVCWLDVAGWGEMYFSIYNGNFSNNAALLNYKSVRHKSRTLALQLVVGSLSCPFVLYVGLCVCSEVHGHENPVFLGGSPQIQTRTASQIMARQSSDTGRHLLSEPGTPLSPPAHGDVFFPVEGRRHNRFSPTGGVTLPFKY